MNIKPIKTRKDYQQALKEIEGLMGARRNSPEGDKLDVLVTLVQAYEAAQFPLEAPTPIEAIRLVMEQRGLTPRDLEPYIGKRNRVYEVLNGRRPITMAMAYKLHHGLNIPAESLLHPAS